MTTAAPVHVYQTFIRASAEDVWRAITDPTFTQRYFHRTAFESSLEPGTPFRMVLPDGRDAVVGEIEVVEPNHRLVMTWRFLYDAALAEERPSRVEWVLSEGDAGVTKVTTIHRDLGASPLTSAKVADGWTWVLQSMKSLVETGEPLPGDEPATDEVISAADEAEAEQHRTQGIAANNSAWELLDGRQLTADETDDLLGRAYAAMYHWRRAARRGPANQARASWLTSRVHAVLGHGELALHHADRCREAVESAGLGDFDLAYAYEARARALACLGRLDEAAAERDLASGVAIAEGEDKDIFDGDLKSEPWFGLAV